jgi:SAM-dependent methyltransferase
MRRTECGGCGDNLVLVLDLGASPLADKFPANADTAETYYPLELMVCPSCWLVQLGEVVSSDELFGSDYAFYTSASPSLREYFAEVAALLLADLKPDSRVVEIACNDGTLLNHFAAAGHRTYGIDPAAPAALARERHPVAMVPFTAQLAAEVGQADLALAFNVAAHVADPHDFLRGVRALLADDGIAVVEFQNLADLVTGCQVDHVYHEHRYFYSAQTFSRLAAQHGLVAKSYTRTPAQGGSLRVTLVPEKPEHLPPVALHWLSKFSTYSSLQPRADRMKDLLLAILDDCGEATVAGYGATAKSATLLNWCGIDTRQVAWVEDVTPAKIGRFTPGTKIPIRAPGERPDYYLVLAWNYLGGIVRREQAYLAGGGRLIVPGPVPCVL